MPRNLVIVESPSKTKPIEKYLGSDYKVLSSKGHVRDLSTHGKYGLGVDVENDFKPDYITMKGKKTVIDELKKEAKKVKFTNIIHADTKVVLKLKNTEKNVEYSYVIDEKVYSSGVFVKEDKNEI